jgi:hypothetical protein
LKPISNGKTTTNECAPFYQKYIALADGDSISEIVENYAFELQEFYNNLP